MLVNTVFNIDLQFKTAAFHLRFAAWFVDSLIMYVYYLLMALMLGFSGSFEELNDVGLVYILVIIPVLIYYPLNEVLFKGQTPGKMLLGIRVVSLDGQKPTLSQLLIRWLIRPIDFGFTSGIGLLVTGNIFIGAVFILGSIAAVWYFAMSPLNQRFGDLIAGTVIVTKKLPYQLSDTIFQELDETGYKVTFPQVMRLSDKDINLLDNLVKQHHKSSMYEQVNRVASKLKSVLEIDNDMPDDSLLEIMLRDYNYLSRQT
ncbi:MAG TPA: RDD family protein [Chitinophagaceae bacterium]|nr:RDD family protein [Chitinophagaceae bacterium]